jgi:sterol 3beta-glucosyltransferase
MHHGGAGTTAIGLQSGVPQMLCPILHPVGDQYFWGKLIEKKGLGVMPIPLKKLTVAKLVQSVEKLLHTDFSKATLHIQSELEKENGLETAALFIEQKFNKQV